MAVQRCLNCVYCVVEPLEWLHSFWRGEYPWPQCANNPYWPGQLHDVSGIACCNYRPKPVLPTGDTVRLIPLGDGFYAYVDKADYEWLSRYTWHLSNGYAFRLEKGKRIAMHREIMQPPKGKLVDHIDGNKANNCRLNLRVCTQAENLRNTCKRHGSRSGFKGVFYDMRFGKWFAQCRLKGKRHWRGYFDNEMEAARAYDRMAVELFGEFARLNFPEEWPPQRRAEIYAMRRAESVVRRSKSKKTKPKKNNSDAKRTTKRCKSKKANGKAAQCKTPDAEHRSQSMRTGARKRPRQETARGRSARGTIRKR